VKYNLDQIQKEGSAIHMETETQRALTSRSAAELASMLARGEVSAVETVEAQIEQIERVNPTLNAVVFKRYDAARAEARQADARRAKGEPLGPLHGVPITIKECLDLEGTPSTFGLSSRANSLAHEDDGYVARMRQAGAIILGKTNVSQLLLYYESHNPVYGRSNNPWNLERTPGGSSGGQAAIIAAGGAPLGLGTDIGGSLRVPATFCGIASLKPTVGRLPDPGRYSVPIGQRAIVSQVGALARRVADVALGLEVMNGGRNPATEPPMPLGDFSTVDVSQLRVASYTFDGTFQPAPAVRRAVQQAAALLKGMGAQVVEWQPPDVPSAQDIFYRILSADKGQGMKKSLGRDKRDPRITSLLMPASMPRRVLAVFSKVARTLGQHSLAGLASNFGYGDTHHYWQVVKAQIDYQARFQAALDQDDGGPFDVILCPACSLPAFTHGASQYLATAGAYALLYNVLGYPAGVVPFTCVRAEEEVGRALSRDTAEKVALKVETCSAGLPVGVQVVARPWREHVALAVMSAIEQAASSLPDYPGLPVLAAQAR
jgi:fatty acid amide hydrolase